jgi:glyoxylase-like metal-dependent hydrolase (beta-lactamase superfamily II)
VTALRAGPLDLAHGGLERVVGCYLVDTDDGLALVDCGPTSCVPSLHRALGRHGVELRDVGHLLLTHIHLDHAGAAGALVREHPGLQVHVSPVGAPHVLDPSRLEASARRLYGEAFDPLLGALVPVPAENVHETGDEALGLACFPTPGHARHHVSYLDGDGTLYAGDAAGVRIAPEAFVVPPLPPPEVDLEAWEQTIAELERRAPTRLALTHFGVFDDVGEHLARLRETIGRWADWVGHGMDEETFVAAARTELVASSPTAEDTYAHAVPLWHCYRGLERYWRKRAAA